MPKATKVVARNNKIIEAVLFMMRGKMPVKLCENNNGCELNQLRKLRTVMQQ